MPTTVTYAQMLTQSKALGARIRARAERHHELAGQLDAVAKGIGRVAEQISVLNVDSSTVAETQELARIMRGVSEAAIAYASAADNAARTARATEQQTLDDHAGIHEARRSAPVPMANRDWYEQE